MDASETQRMTSTYQNILVLRHGDRIDHLEPLWAATAARPWDPPLVPAGMARAFSTGRKFRAELRFPIHRVIVSPFLRCVQTASEAISALSAVDDGVESSDGIATDHPNLKVSIEYGLCEMLNREAIALDAAPKDGNFDFNISELEAMFPAGTVDHSVERVYLELPQWEETEVGAAARYAHSVKALADKFPSENLLLVTHAQAIAVTASAFLKNSTIHSIEYCSYLHLRRPISLDAKESFAPGNFELCDQRGVNYIPSSVTTNDPLSQPNVI
ncbi:uncharacterized protein LOC127813980 [Diospyros lotus]|uniref:uncharacterized protein LOC127813980 n=1 Tax=Diospyros lotus TaxID=55363 RepID=UPI00225737A3|nr:uncharacterized protein LOC127813980 [Diospyros lotus]